jgi:hypothetical protein
MSIEISIRPQHGGLNMRFLMIAQPRTGTMLLRTLLNQHAKIYVYGEIFYPEFFFWGFFSHLLPAVNRDVDNLLPTKWSTHVVDYLEGLTGMMVDAGKSIVGFDVKIPQISFVPNFHGSVEHAGFAVMHVRRRNSLAAILSYETMRRRTAEGGSAHPTAPSENISMHVDPAWLGLCLAEYETQDQWINHIYGGKDYLELWYEDFASPDVWNGACRKLSAFFGIELQLPFAPAIVKQNSANMADLIENSDEIKHRFPRFF